MIKLFKIFLIFCSLFISLSANTCEINNCANSGQTYFSSKEERVINSPDKNEFYIVSSNHSEAEIFVSRSKNIFSGNKSFDRVSLNYINFLSRGFLNKLYFNKSHNISSYLSNEICTRAP